MSIYNELILDHAKTPLNEGELGEYTHTLTLKNVSCGDVVTVYLTVKNGVVTDVAHKSEGCAISRASASMVTEHIKAMPVKQVLALTKDDVVNLLHIELTPNRLKCALIPLEALQKAIKSALQ